MGRSEVTKEKDRLRAARYYKENKEKILPKLISYGKAYRKLLKQEALAHYGKRCYCCQESIATLLTIDHINNNGSAHRHEIYDKNIRAGYNFYLRLKREGWPPEYQTACFNCNQGRYINGGICPHQEGSNA